MEKIIKPHFILLHQWIYCTLISLFPPVTFFLTLIIYFLIIVIFSFLNLPEELSLFISFLAAILLVPIGATKIIRKYYAHTKFVFEKDRAVYSNDFVTTVIKEVKYINAKEIFFKQGILQKKWDLGTIYILTHATPYMEKQESGLKLYDVHQPLEVYNYLKEQIDAAEKNRN